jgi:O-antigen/teichoic acid export membrane protein
MQRDLDWRRIRLTGFTSFFFANTIALMLAIAGLGAVALMAAVVLMPVTFIMDMALRRPDLFRVSFDFRGYGEALRFGALRSAGAALGQGRLVAENFTLSGVLGLATVGLYNRAFGFAQLTAGWLSGQLATIAYPMLAKLTPGTDGFSRASGLLVRLALWTFVPPALAVAWAAEAAVSVIYGEGWLDIVPVIHPMLCVVLALALGGVLNVIGLSALGARFVFMSNAGMLGSGLLALFFALPVSLSAYISSLAVALGAVVIAMGTILVRRGVLSTRDLTRASAPCLALCVIGCIAWYTIVFLPDVFPTSPDDIPQWVELIIVSTGCVGAMLVLVRLLDPRGLAEVLRFAPDRVRVPVARLFLLPAIATPARTT